METRITQEALRRHVLRVLRCWRERYLFSDDYLNGLQAAFLQPTAASPEALAAANPGLAASLGAMTPEELERKCRCDLAVACGLQARKCTVIWLFCSVLFCSEELERKCR